MLILLAAAHALEIHDVTWKGARYTVVSVEVGERVDLVGQTSSGLRTLPAALGSDPGATVAVNAGMYHRSRRPVGLHVEDGVERSPLETRELEGNFGLLPNGVFAMTATGPVVETTDAWRVAGHVPIDASQSGPMLVIDGALHPAFRPLSTNLNVRNGVGVDGTGRSHWVISRDPVRFHDLATLFRDRLGCPDALYLDGHVSRLQTRTSPDQDGVFGGVFLLGG